MSIERKTQALIEVAEEFRAGRCAALLASAHEESRRMLAEAQRSARKRLREALDGDRARLAGSLAEAQAQLITARRVRMQKRMAAALGEAWPRLEHSLLDRWQSPAGRADWVEHHLAVAIAVLPAAAWTILHPPQWPSAERDQAHRWLQQHGGIEARFAPDATLSSGIRVVCGMNVLDASFEGLLADRAAIEGRLLHYIEDLA